MGEQMCAGCILFECLAGQMPFAGDTSTDVLARVIGTEPDWESLPSGVPPDVDATLRRCLVKDRNRRLRHAGDLRLVLEDGASRSPRAENRDFGGSRFQSIGGKACASTRRHLQVQTCESCRGGDTSCGDASTGRDAAGAGNCTSRSSAAWRFRGTGDNWHLPSARVGPRAFPYGVSIASRLGCFPAPSWEGVRFSRPMANGSASSAVAF